ncbi:MAG TPA: hypothetical protein VFJ47_01485 [Terriglobales bacterium]|nr:hypothetical protein [Terriglobales bacterium]
MTKENRIPADQFQCHLRLSPVGIASGCAALVIGPEVQWDHVATLCDWIKINSPEKPILLLSDRRNTRWPTHIDVVVPTQPVQALVERLHVIVPTTGEDNCKVEAGVISDALGLPSRVRHS